MALEAISLYGLPVDRCPKCKGIWFDGSELERMIRTYTSDAVSAGKTVTDAVPSDATIILPSNAMKWVCPRDGAKLERIAYAGDRGTAIEHCDSCGGWWFDHDDVDRALMLHVPDPVTERIATLLLREKIRLDREQAAEQARLMGIFRSVGAIAAPYGIFFFLAHVIAEIIRHIYYTKNSDA